MLPPERRTEIVAAIGEALDGRELTRDELGTEIGRRVGAWSTEGVGQAFGGQWPRWHLALGQAALDGVFVFGPPRANQVTYVRLDQWLGALPEVDGLAALREVCRRYFGAYGPATAAEFARWFAMAPRDARAVMASLGDELEEVEVDGVRRTWRRGSAIARAGASVRLLPQFDCYIVGCHPREQLIPSCAPPELQKGTAAPFSVLLVDGVVAGLWERARRGKTLEVRVDAFQPLRPDQQEEVAEQAQRVAEILELDTANVKVSYETVKPRPHM
jgi:hypothetical protein